MEHTVELCRDWFRLLTGDFSNVTTTLEATVDSVWINELAKWDYIFEPCAVHLLYWRPPEDVLLSHSLTRLFHWPPVNGDKYCNHMFTCSVMSLLLILLVECTWPNSVWASVFSVWICKRVKYNILTSHLDLFSSINIGCCRIFLNTIYPWSGQLQYFVYSYFTQDLQLIDNCIVALPLFRVYLQS